MRQLTRAYLLLSREVAWFNRNEIHEYLDQSCDDKTYDHMNMRLTLTPLKKGCVNQWKIYDDVGENYDDNEQIWWLRIWFNGKYCGKNYDGFYRYENSDGVGKHDEDDLF